MSDKLPTDPASRSSSVEQESAAWWWEPELALLLVLVVGAYFTRMTALTIRGEESRRGLIAREMLETGDWIVPRCQGVPLFSRPPLQNWLIAAAGWFRGGVDQFSLRFPSDCAILLTVVMIYGYARTFLTKLGALTAGAAYASMGQVVELGRTGETDALFTLLVSGSLLVWHVCQVHRASPYKTWCLGYLLAALGTLTKGPQAPVYFAGTIGAYLLLTRQWRFAFSRAHAAGIATFCGVYGMWQLPFLWKLGAEGAGQMYVNDVGHRFLDMSWRLFFTHLAEYPLETLVCLLPWSGLLIVWCNRQFRQTLGCAQPHAVFLALALAVAFPTVWLPPGSRPRYLMCLYPCVALLVAIVVDRVALSAGNEPWRNVWTVFVRCCAVVIAGAGLAALAVTLAGFNTWLKQPLEWTGPYALGAVAVAALAWWLPARQTGLRCRAAILAIAGFVPLSYDTLLINAFQGTSVDTATAVARLETQLPPGTKLVSFGQIQHLFAFYYHDKIPVLPWPEADDPQDETIRYFCAEPGPLERTKLPFRYERLADINCDRHRLEHVKARVIICRRLDPPQTASRKAADPAIRD
jgi:4-amino-4-deoxy-L-arabinose transferase-like glycosyltransferase